jgi:digeranylgeranylglycerophospholipid reductase
MYDFVVVGAGPAGSRFARSAAEAGRDVLVLESSEIGRPLACSGHVSLDIWDFIPETAHENLFQNDIYGARFHLGGGGQRGPHILQGRTSIERNRPGWPR